MLNGTMLLSLSALLRLWVRRHPDKSFARDFQFSRAGTQVNRSAISTFAKWLSLTSGLPGPSS